MIKLYQFPFSHFCEKARWALDCKGAGYHTVNLLPGFHTMTMRGLAPETSVPVIRDGEKVIQGSPAIISYLDAKYPEALLTPRDPEAARQALEWERYFDEEIGVMLRRWFYYHALSNRRLALSFLLQGSAWYKRPAFLIAFPLVRPAMMRFMNIGADTAKAAEERLRCALDRLDQALNGREFLAGDRFSRADLAACALLSPWCLPDDLEASAKFPPAVLKLRDEFKGRPFFRWVQSVYRSHRQPPRRPSGAG